MKRFMITTIILCAFAVSGAFAGEVKGQRLVGLDNYMSYFSDGHPPRRAGNLRVSADYSRFLDIYHKMYDSFCELGGDEYKIDTTLEWALSSYYSSKNIRSRPIEADAILPANNPKLADQKLGAAVFQEIQILRFLGNTEAVSRHEAVLKFITDRKNVTRQEIETFYKGGIRGLVSDVVDERYDREKKIEMGFGVGSEVLVEIKNTITNFMLTPSNSTYGSLLQAYRRYSGDGAIVLGGTMIEINSAVADALINYKTLP